MSRQIFKKELAKATYTEPNNKVKSAGRRDKGDFHQFTSVKMTDRFFFTRMFIQIR